MERMVARWYTGMRRSGSQTEEWRKQVSHLSAGLPHGTDAIEVAPGPGYFAIELAWPCRFHVSGLDISHTLVRIAREHARQAGVSVDSQGTPPHDGGQFVPLSHSLDSIARLVISLLPGELSMLPI